MKEGNVQKLQHFSMFKCIVLIKLIMNGRDRFVYTNTIFPSFYKEPVLIHLLHLYVFYVDGIQFSSSLFIIRDFSDLGHVRLNIRFSLILKINP